MGKRSSSHVVLALALAASVVTATSASADDRIFQRRPDRLIIESGQRISDGRKLQSEADKALVRVEDRDGAGVQGDASANRRSESSPKTAAAEAGRGSAEAEGNARR
jgi:hypothetical protein